MAVVARRGSIGISAHTAVLTVRLSLLVSRRRVAVDAGKLRIIRRNLVAIGAHRAIMRKCEPRVCKRRAKPAGRRVAGITGGRIASGNVIRYAAAECLRAVPFRQMASVANGVCGSQRVIVANMAIRTRLYTACRRNNMSTGQRPARRAVVELAIRPVHRVMATRTHTCWEIGRDMVGNRPTEGLGTIPVIGVATGAPAVTRGQAIVVAGVALVAVGGGSCR